jgi:hypothetical protein
MWLVYLFSNIFLLEFYELKKKFSDKNDQEIDVALVCTTKNKKINKHYDSQMYRH